jgi:flavin-dependent dehydrogenase
MVKRRTEVLIVGGGPAGAACAWRLRQEGVECLVLERRRFPRVKPCAGWITPQVVRDLALDPAAYPGGFTTFGGLTISIRGFRFRLPTRQHAIVRQEFDDWLLRRAGVPVEVHKVDTITQMGDEYVVDGAFSGRYLVGAGGTHCPVYRTLFRESSPRQERSLIVALEEEFRYPHTDGRCRLWFMAHGLRGYGWYVPKEGGIVNVGIGGKAEALRAAGDHIQRHWGLLVDKLERMGLVRGHPYRPRGYVYHVRQTRPEVRRDNALIAGDAVGLATMDMGEGIGPAIRSGMLAAEAIVNGGAYDVGAISRVSLLPDLRGFLTGRHR